MPLQDSTHDATTTAGSPFGLAEAWADIKAPGTGIKVAVGTIDITIANATSRFSNSPLAVTLPPAPATQWTVAPQFPPRQVVILQGTDDAGVIQFQSYFYGFTAALANKDLGDGLATNARGISIFPNIDPAATRIAICGETFDEEIPGSGDVINTNASAGSCGGFIAVFDGNGALQWSHHFFGSGANNCAITDVSMRVDPVTGDDIVTYCGISSNGSPAGGTLGVVEPFLSVPGAAAGCNLGVGNSALPAGQWDGIVGRLRRPAGGPTAVVFHSMAGGAGQDGLFGIAEIQPLSEDEDRFVVVGCTAAGPQAGGGFVFPLSNGICAPAQSYVGVAMVFNAAAIGAQTPGPLDLESSSPIGTFGNRHTLARDVVVQDNAVVPNIPGQTTLLSVIHVVGSTDDPNLFPSLFPPVVPSFQTTLNGPTDGFIASAMDIPFSGFMTFHRGSYRGGPGNDGLTGIAAWNEHADHVAALGFTDVGDPADRQMDVISVFVDTPVLATQVPPPLGLVGNLLLNRANVFGGTALETPTAMGAITATTAMTFDVQGLGSPAGGGISVDQRGRTHAVGATVSPMAPNSYPVTLPPFVAGRQLFGGQDAVRTSCDPLPAGVGRTDGTGSRVFPLGISPFQGVTTPTCDLSAFGRLIGGPALPLERILIDYEGLPPAGGVAVNILVDRPPGNAALIGTFLQFGFPTPMPIDPLPVSLVESWTGIGPFVQVSGPLGLPYSFRNSTLSALPPGPAQFTVQALFLLGVNLPNGPACASVPPRTVLNLAASPALAISY